MNAGRLGGQQQPYVTRAGRSKQPMCGRAFLSENLRATRQPHCGSMAYGICRARRGAASGEEVEFRPRAAAPFFLVAAGSLEAGGISGHSRLVRWQQGGTQSGWGGIRTPGTLTGTAVFKTAALDHSATHPVQQVHCSCLCSPSWQSSKVSSYLESDAAEKVYQRRARQQEGHVNDRLAPTRHMRQPELPLRLGGECPCQDKQHGKPEGGARVGRK
jgi:hypothetical protein